MLNKIKTKRELCDSECVLGFGGETLKCILILVSSYVTQLLHATICKVYGNHQ